MKILAQTTLKRSLSALAVVGMGLCLPMGLPANANGPEPVTVEAMNGDRTKQSEPASALFIEDRIQQAEGIVTREYTFTGNANEIIVAYWEGTPEYGAQVELYSPTGETVRREYTDHGGNDISELAGRLRSFRLSETGEYRLVFTADPDYFYDDSSDASDYLLRVRVASYYERLMIHGLDLIDEERPEEAISTFTSAIEQRPDLPLPYLGRLFAYASAAMAGSDTSPNGIEEVYALYQELEPATRTVVLTDLRQVTQLLTDAIANGETTEEAIDLEPTFFGDIADYFETGEIPDSLQEIM